jgi:hypothetical protein
MWVKDAIADRSLYYVTSDTLQVIAEPGQPRPGEEGYTPPAWAKA